MRNYKREDQEEFQPFEEDDFGHDEAKKSEYPPVNVEKTAEQLLDEFEARRKARTRGGD